MLGIDINFLWAGVIVVAFMLSGAMVVILIAAALGSAWKWARRYWR